MIAPAEAAAILRSIHEVRAAKDLEEICRSQSAERGEDALELANRLGRLIADRGITAGNLNDIGLAIETVIDFLSKLSETGS